MTLYQTIQSGLDVWTYSDLVAYVLDTHAVDRTGLNLRHAREAVRRAYRDLPVRHSWNYYYRQRVLQTSADYATGTVAYVHTGGTYERQLTLASGTWPSWAAYGRVVIDDVHYEVEDRKSSTVVTLADSSNPGQDVAAGETYTLYRNSYPLPVDFHQLDALWLVSEVYPLSYVDQRTQHTALQYFYSSPGTPRHYTIRATGKYLNGIELVFGPPPDSIQSYDMLYQALPRPLTIEEYSTGTVAITSATAAVTGTSTTFPTTCAGSVIRFAASGITKPTGYQGSIDGADNPFVYQGVIKSRDSATTLTLTEAMPSTISSLSVVGYTISDPIDIDPGRMLSVLQVMAEAEFCRLAARQDTAAKQTAARKALLEAMEADELVSNTHGHAVYTPFKRTTVTTET